METIHVKTGSRTEMISVTSELQRIVRGKDWKNGVLLVFCPHTTAGLTVNENADPDVRRDMTAFMNEAVPRESGFRHAEGNSDAHIKTSLFGPHVMLIVENGKLCLGTWQEVYFCEWDGPRSRSLWVQFTAA